MFVARPAVLLDLLAEWHPEFAATLRDLAKDTSRLDELWPRLPKIALDHAIAEPAAAAGRVVVVPASIGWDDVGDFDSLASLLADADGTRVLGDASLVRSVDSTGLVVPRSGRVVAVVGLEDIVVVDTADALLVTTRAHAQQVKQVVTGLQQDGRGDLT
jgi:mannose-1-phosphate guanylyltransferase